MKQNMVYFSFVLLLLMGAFSCSSTDDPVTEEVIKDMESTEPVIDYEELPPGDGLAIGIPAPIFELSDGYGDTYSLNDYISSKNVVIVFYRTGT